jgi:hypothetical protein
MLVQPGPARRRAAATSPTGTSGSPAEFDEVAADLGRTLDFTKVPKSREGGSSGSHKDEVTAATARPLSVQYPPLLQTVCFRR